MILYARHVPKQPEIFFLRRGGPILEAIYQQNDGVTSFVDLIAKSAGIVSNGSANSAAEGSLISGFAMSNPLTLATLTEKFLSGGATAGGAKKERG